jgi:RNA exonuclease 4
VSQVALVDQNEKIVLNFFVKPSVPVLSTLNALTGIRREDLDQGVSLEEGLRMLRAAVPKEAILLGQNILMDIQWLGLVEGQDFTSLLDLAGLFRVYNPNYRNYRYHSLQHKIKYLLGGEQYDTHNAATDAIWSVRLFNLFKRIEKDRELWGRCQEILSLAPMTPSFSALNPTLDGVCLGSRKSCTCGAPFFG